MYFSWKDFPLKTPEQIKAAAAEPAPVVIVGAGPVGLALALGLAQHDVRCIVLERRSAISEGSRALAMNRRSMQILDQLGVGQAILDKAVTWSEGWTFYGKELVHYMNVASAPNEKHGQTNLQQCWMEQLLLDEIEKYPQVDVRYGHEVCALRSHDDRVDLDIHTSAGPYTLSTQYLAATDGPRGNTRRQLGLDYEGISYTQRFVINDIICKLPLPKGRRLFFSPPYLPGKAVLMHQAPFDMWRLDFQLMDDQDADEEMQPEKVHARIRAHFDLLEIDADYELLLTSIYKTNALSLPTYNLGRIVFAGDAAHQVPIFGGRGVNHGYADTHNLAWKLALAVKGSASPAILDTYTQERRGAILDTLAELTKTTMFITTPSPGIALVREAVLSLSVDETFLNDLFDPYTSPPFEYTDSVLNTVSADEADFKAHGRPGAIAPDAVIGANGERLYDQFGPHFIVVQFTADPAGHHPAIADLSAFETATKLLKLPADSEAGRLLDARPGTTYLIRPDNRVAARWRRWPDADLDRALSRAMYKTRKTGSAS